MGGSMSYLYNIFLAIATAWRGDHLLCNIRLSTWVGGWEGVGGGLMSYLYNIFLAIATAWGGDYSLCNIRLSTWVVGWKGVWGVNVLPVQYLLGYCPCLGR